MPECSKCGKPVSGALCPNCKTPVVGLAKQADPDFDIYEGFTTEEVSIFNQYLRLVQNGWLEVAAVDWLSTEHNKELEEIKIIIKRGLKALQKAQERAQREAELKARQLAKDEKKAVRQAARQARGRQKHRIAFAVRAGFLKKPWVWAPALAALLVIAVFISWPQEKPVVAEPPPPAPPPVTENYFLRQGRVVCYQQQDMEQITRVANDRRRFEEILASGRCFINQNYVRVTDISQVSGSLRKGHVQGQGWLFFHHEGLEIISQP